MGMATVLGTGDSDGEMDCTGDRGGQTRAGVEALGSHGTAVSQLSVRFLVNKA